MKRFLTLFLLLCGAGLAPPLQALELTTEGFFLCRKKTAVSVSLRAVRVHYFPEEGRCLVIQSIQGRDSVIARGKWRAFCRKRARERKEKWRESLWECGESLSAGVFYPVSSPAPASDIPKPALPVSEKTGESS